MVLVIKRIAGWFYDWLVVKPKALAYLIANTDLYVKSASYYPEELHKNSFQIFCDQCRNVLKYGWPDDYYFMYGLDRIGSSAKGYIHYSKFMKCRNAQNNKVPYNSISILRNKFYFGIFSESIGIKTGHNVCLTYQGQFYIIDEKRFVSVEEFVGGSYLNKMLFCKLLDGECGVGIFTLEIKNGVLLYDGNPITLKELSDRIGSSRYLFQESVTQHSEMSKIYHKSINTIRLITVKHPKTGKIETLPSVLRIGANGNYVDNFSQGGLCVGFEEESGRLHDTAFYKPGFGLRAIEHPNSGVKFNTFIIPHITEAVKQAKYFHSMLSDIHSIGWDIAISDDGPVFIEGNDNWEVSLPQVCHHGLEEEFKELFY